MYSTVLEREARLMYSKRGCVQYSSRERSKADAKNERFCIQFKSEKQDNVQKEMSCTYTVLESEVGCCTEREILYSSRGRSRLMYRKRDPPVYSSRRRSKADVKIDNSCTIQEGKAG